MSNYDINYLPNIQQKQFVFEYKCAILMICVRIFFKRHFLGNVLLNINGNYLNIHEFYAI